MRRVCAVETCERLTRSGALCAAHYQRQRLTGSLRAELPIGQRVYTHTAADLADVTTRVRREAAWLTAVILVGMANEVPNG